MELDAEYAFLFDPTNGRVIDSNDEQPLKAADPIEITLFGIVIDVSDEQPQKALELISVILLGMVIDVSDEQL